MSNLRSDCRDLVKDLPPGDTYRAHIERLCYQIDEIEEYWHDSNKRLKEIRELLEKAVCVTEPDMGVILLSSNGPTHTEVVNGRPSKVYDHQYFSPLGDALISIWKKTQNLAWRSDLINPNQGG